MDQLDLTEDLDLGPAIDLATENTAKPGSIVGQGTSSSPIGQEKVKLLSEMPAIPVGDAGVKTKTNPASSSSKAAPPIMCILCSTRYTGANAKDSTMTCKKCKSIVCAHIKCGFVHQEKCRICAPSFLRTVADKPAATWWKSTEGEKDPNFRANFLLDLQEAHFVTFGTRGYGKCNDPAIGEDLQMYGLVPGLG